MPANDAITALRREVISIRDANEKLTDELTLSRECINTQASLISIRAEREALLLSCITNALAALDRNATGSARFHLLAANAHPRLEALTLEMQTASAALQRAGVDASGLFVPELVTAPEIMEEAQG